MSAMIIAFPKPAPTSAVRRRAAPVPLDPAPIFATALATKFTDHFLPICQASIDLLEADDRDFEARCRVMLDADGSGNEMIDELCAELQIAGRQMQVLVDGLELTRARLRTAMARLGPNYREICGSCSIEETS